MTAPDLTSASRAHLLELDDVKTWFTTPRGMLRAVDGVSLTVDAGRTLGVVGESGSGKTVLGRSILHLLPENAVAAGGAVYFEGRDLRRLGTRDLRRMWGREMSVVFQDALTSLNPVMTVGNQIGEVFRFRSGLSRSRARQRVGELLWSVGIPEPEIRARQYPHELSGGMLQRITIATALAADPKLLIADEPTTALDVTVQAQILDLLERQQRERDMALILVTHDLGVVAGRTDRTVVMYAGRIVEDAPTTRLFTQPHHPYTEGLLAALPRLETPAHTPIATIPGRVPDLIGENVGCPFAPRCRYAQDRCRSEAPPLATGADPDHRYACFFPLGIAPKTFTSAPVVNDIPAATPLDPKARM